MIRAVKDRSLKEQQTNSSYIKGIGSQSMSNMSQRRVGRRGGIAPLTLNLLKYNKTDSRKLGSSISSYICQ